MSLELGLYLLSTRFYVSTQDNSDAQYRSYRTNLPALAALMAGFFGLKYAYMRPVLRDSSPANNLHRVPFYLIFLLIMLTILHGASVLKVLVILSANFALAKATGGTRFAVPVTWPFNAGVLLATEWYEGYPFANLHSGFAFLDTSRGVYPRWHVNFNITMLRLVSFSIDYHWACSHIGVADVGNSLSFSPVHETDVKFSQPGGELSDKKRAAVFHPRSTYTFLNYLSYALYAPLYIAGPILTFNDFMWQVRKALSPVLGCASSFYDLAISPKRHRAAGDNAIRDSLLHHPAHNGNADPCDARRRDQGRTCMERHDACPAFHDRFLESHLRLAQGSSSIT